MGKVMKWTINAFLAVAVLTVLSFFLAPRFLHLDFFTIQSGSMRPTIPVGSVVITRPVDAGEIEAGDIIAFNSGPTGDKVIVHRVEEVLRTGESSSFRTHGDANTAPDGDTVLPENVIGQVFFNLPLLGYFSAFIKTRTGFILAVALPGLIIISLEVWNIVNTIASQPRRKPVLQPPKAQTGPWGEIPQRIPARQPPLPQPHRQPLPASRPVEIPAASYIACKKVISSAAPASARDPHIEAEAARIVAQIKAQLRTSGPAKG